MGKAILYRSVCKAVLCLLTITNLAVGQSSTPNLKLFAGCYEVTSLYWKPSGEEIGLIPKRFQLLTTRPEGIAWFDIRDLESEKARIGASGWRPKGSRKIEIDWSTGLGGFRGKLDRSANGDLKGKLKEWCDYRCEGGRITGRLQIHPIACPPD
jgi:hypothetical protein